LTQLPTKPKNIWTLVPLIGNFLFIVLYVIAALLYPGGSGTDKTSIGYNWTENYWCNLLSEQAINGQLNTARPFAIIAMIILCVSLSSFWILFPILALLKKNHRLLIQLSGSISMITSFLLLTNADHDFAINISSSFGFIVMVATIIALRQLKLSKLFLFGLFNILLIALNNYLYHTQQMTYLPIVQKFSFLSFLVWFSWIDLKLYLPVATR
jgi:hypothetical protein